jgi:hypothetical protein
MANQMVERSVTESLELQQGTPFHQLLQDCYHVWSFCSRIVAPNPPEFNIFAIAKMYANPSWEPYLLAPLLANASNEPS